MYTTPPSRNKRKENNESTSTFESFSRVSKNCPISRSACDNEDTILLSSSCDNCWKKGEKHKIKGYEIAERMEKKSKLKQTANKLENSQV